MDATAEDNDGFDQGLDGQDKNTSFWDSEGVFKAPPPTHEMLRELVAGLCTDMEYLRSWWSAHENIIRAIPEANASRVHDIFVEGAMSARSVARCANITIDTELIYAYRWTRPPEEQLPQPPDFGPPPPYTWLGDNLGLGSEPKFIHVKTPQGNFDTSLSEVLRNIDLFAEPGRTRILWMLPFIFDIPRPLNKLGERPARQHDFFHH